MRVDWATACRYVETQGGTATIIGAGIDTYWVRGFPANIQATVVARLVGMPQEVGQPHKLTAQVLDPQMEVTGQPLEAGFTGQLTEQHRSGWEQGTFIRMVVRFRAEAAGTYTLDIAVDDQSYTLPLVAAQGPPPG